MNPSQPPLSGAEKITWNLSGLYGSAGSPQLKQDLETGLAAAQSFAQTHRGRLASYGPPELQAALEALEKVLAAIQRPLIYAELSFAADSANPKLQALLQTCREAQARLRQSLIFFDLEWLALDDGQAEKLLAHPALARFCHHLKVSRAQKPHTLSEPEEKALELKSLTGRLAWVRLFDQTLAGLSCQIGQETMPLQGALAQLYRPNREQRKAAAQAITATLAANLSQMAFMANTLAADHAGEDELRHRPGPMHSRNLENEISQESVDALLAACEGRMAMVPRYYRLKQKLLGLDTLYDYDRYAPLKVALPPMSWEQARQTVLEAFGGFSPQMAQVAALFFEQGWIDAGLRPGKAGGAFSAPTLPDLNPFILMNYTGNLRDVMTLAHELGHGVHQYLSQPQGLFHMRTPLTTAETASVFGEMLVFRALMAGQTDENIRLALLCGKIEEAFATVFRQAVMTRFEQKVHQHRRAQGELSLEEINHHWLEANRPMMGDAVQMTEGYATWWSYIPHFVHTPFYCYAYSFGELLVLALLDQFDQEGEPFKAKYLAMLASGGSLPPEKLVAGVGLDITGKGFWDKGLNVLESMVAQAEALAAR